MKFKKSSLTILALTLALTLGGCTTAEVKNREIEKESAKILATQGTLGVNWYQTSGEMRALYYQGYNLATKNLKQQLKTPTSKPYSIILDLDETVLDNSPYQAENIKIGQGFDPVSWNEWVEKKEAKAVPGAKEFLDFADKNGVQIYYISDRTTDQLKATIENLKAEGIPVQEGHVLLKETTDKSGKVNRRNYVMEHTNLIMLFGDNLSDFEEFSKTSITDRNSKVDELKAEFGDKFIIFPNPIYGNFENAIYNGAKTNSEKIKAREEALRGYELLN